MNDAKNVRSNARAVSAASRPVQIAAGALVALVLFGGGYAAGSGRAQSASPTATSGPQAAAGRGQLGGAGGAQNRNLVNGQIISVNPDSITIMVRTPGTAGASAQTGSELILVGSGTRVVRMTETDIKLSDLKVGDTITVAGTPDTANGTVSAQAIVVGATNIFGELFGGPRPSPSPRPSPTR